MQHESDADRIYKEVEKRKERAERLGIKELIGGLYFNNLHFYPHWLKNGPEYVCSLIEDAVEVCEKDEKGKIKKE